jgi:hypothetical protein
VFVSISPDEADLPAFIHFTVSMGRHEQSMETESAAKAAFLNASS